MGLGLLLLGAGVLAGLFGSLLGLGGGVLIVPLLTLAFGLPVRDAVGVSLVCVIVTSGASAAVYLQRDVANLRLGMVLELFTAIGAVIGGAIAFLLDERTIAGLFGALLIYTAATMLRGQRSSAAPSTDEGPADPEALVAPNPEPAPQPASAAARPGFVASLARPGYSVRRLRPAALGSVFAGVMSAILGIGGGLVKVPLMHLVMGVPLRVATATSNLMIGITASTSAIVYLIRGGIDPYAAGPTAIGVFLGAAIGSRAAHRIDLRLLRWLFAIVLLYTAMQMLGRAGLL